MNRGEELKPGFNYPNVDQKKKEHQSHVAHQDGNNTGE